MTRLRSALSLPDRPQKPRRTGRTNILDKGVAPGQLDDELRICAPHVDLAKLGWGTAVVTPCLREKIDVYVKHAIDVSFGGTLFELCYLRDALDEYEAFLTDLGLPVVEISNGTLDIEQSVKVQLIKRFTANFRVVSEVGSKDAAAVVSPARWVEAINAELEAGAEYVILEGRESGSAGMYRGSGEIRMGLIQEILDSGIPPERLLFEAPQKHQQVWLIETIGPDVNLANIPLSDVISVETLRLGLRADTLRHFHGDGFDR
jgi:phosphosulfolactate synthase